MDDQRLKMRRESAVALAKRSWLTVPLAEALMLECRDNLETADRCLSTSAAFGISPFDVASAIRRLGPCPVASFESDKG